MSKEEDEFYEEVYMHNPETRHRYRLAAENGDVDAQVKWADLRWLEEKYEEAARWYRKAARLGSAAAQFSIGSMIYDGEIEGDLDEMVGCFFAASEAWFLARFMMGECYRLGRGLPQSYEKAMVWFLMGELESIGQERRLEACCKFFHAAPSEYDRAYAVDKRTPDMKRLVRENAWKELTPEELAEGLCKLTEYEIEKGVR